MFLPKAILHRVTSCNTANLMMNIAYGLFFDASIVRLFLEFCSVLLYVTFVVTFLHNHECMDVLQILNEC
jgi:hypothetical protein